MPTEVRYPLSNDLKREIAGENEAVFRQIEDRFSVIIHSRLHDLRIEAKNAAADISGALALLDQAKLAIRNGTFLAKEWTDRISRTDFQGNPQTEILSQTPILRNRQGISVVPKTASQTALVKACETNDILFADGPAGTGKTFLAVAIAVASLENHETERICLVRPAVEAGESLGYLPGDLKEKIAPYLRPIHDSLAELLPSEKLRKYQEEGRIEVAPLAYMRGRTLKHSFIILDEAQNTTIPQMQMFLTRLGQHSKAIVAGDSSQIDLGPRQVSGFAHAIRLLKGVRGIAHIPFPATDVLRHPLVREIIKAYESGGKK